MIPCSREGFFAVIIVLCVLSDYLTTKASIERLILSRVKTAATRKPAGQLFQNAALDFKHRAPGRK